MCRKLALPALAFLLSLALAFPASARTVTDMRGKQIHASGYADPCGHH